MRVRSLLFLTLTLVAPACGGSTATGQQPDTATLIQNACNNVVGLQCNNGPTLQQCESGLDQEQAQAAAKGCVSDFDAVAECFADQLTSCSQDSGGVCKTQLDALGACEWKTTGGNVCSQGMGTAPPGTPSYYQKCDITCSSWGVQCETKTSPTVVCTCSTGPKAGATFTITSCKDLSTSLAAPHCQ